MQDLQITYEKVNDLVPYDKNARAHQDKDVDAIVASIKEFGFSDPIGLWKNNVIVEGHGRLMAAKKIGMEEVPCIHLDHLTDEQRKAYALAHNKTAELSSWDIDLLGSELQEITEIDMAEFGFDLSEFEEEPGDIEEDEVPEVPEEPKAKLGDLYQLGDHRLICGDSTDVLTIEKLMGGQKADMVFTDPPYGYEYQSNFRTKTEKFDVLENDDRILDFFPNIINLVEGFVMICTSWKVLAKWLPLFTEYYPLTNMIIWEKGGGSMGDLSHTFGTDYEIILVSNNGAEIKEKRLMSVWKVGRDDVNSYKHPTQKPVELAATAIKHTTDKEEKVLDVFGGSGSTLIACEQLKRKCFMCELDPKYVDVIIQRWENLTGKKAVLLNGQETMENEN